MSILLGIVLFALTFSSHAHEMQEPKCQISEGFELCNVNILDLLSHPHFYNGKFVVVSGLYKNGFEENAIYLSRDYVETPGAGYAIWLAAYGDDSHPGYKFLKEDSELESWRGSLVSARKASGYITRVAGVFTAGKSGHLGMYSGKIRVLPHFYHIIDGRVSREKAEMKREESKKRLEQLRKERDKREKLKSNKPLNEAD